MISFAKIIQANHPKGGKNHTIGTEIRKNKRLQIFNNGK
jgi:hypothetical protein